MTDSFHYNAAGLVEHLVDGELLVTFAALDGNPEWDAIKEAVQAGTVVIAPYTPPPEPPALPTTEDLDFADELLLSIDPGGDTWGEELLAWAQAYTALTRPFLPVPSGG